MNGYRHVPELSAAARQVLRDIAQDGSSEGLAVADCLAEIAAGIAEEQGGVDDAQLVTCAEELAACAKLVASRLSADGGFTVEHALRGPRADDLPVQVTFSQRVVSVYVDECGTRNAQEGDGPLLVIDRRGVRPRVRIWGDPTQLDPTVTVDLSGTPQRPQQRGHRR